MAVYLHLRRAYTKPNIFASTCEALWAFYLISRGSERGVTTTACLANIHQL